MQRLEQLNKIFDKIDEEKRAIIEPLLPQVVFMETELARLNIEVQKLQRKTAEGVKIHPQDPIRKAPREYQQTMQAYLNAIKVLQKTLYMAGAEAESPLLKALQEFEDHV